MKKLLNWFILAMLIVVAAPITGCGDDDDTLNFPEVTADGIQGTWTKGEVYKTTEKAEVDYTGTIYDLKNFTLADGQIEATTAANEKVSGTYSLNGDQLTIKVGSIDQTLKATYQGFNKNILGLQWATKGVVGASETSEGQTVDVKVTVHWDRSTK